MRIRPVLAMAAVVAALSVMVVDVADARRTGSVGSRGTRTFQAPPTTTTAPTGAAPIQRSTTPQAAPSTNPAAAAQARSRSGFFGSTLAGGLMRGLVVGGLIGLLLGHGLGGLGGLFGLLLQGALLALVVVLVMRFFRRRQSVPAGAYGRVAPAGAAPSGAAYGGPAGRRAIPGLGGRPATPPPPPPHHGSIDEIGLTGADFDIFERLLMEIETAFGRADTAALRARTTPEVFDYLAEELSENAAKGMRNDISDVQLLQGDLAEAWREGPKEYATVAMRYLRRDVTLEIATGRNVTGDREEPTEATALWTFVRELGGPWRLSALQTA